MLLSVQDVDDVMQEVALVCWRKFREYNPNEAPGAFFRWACVVARFEVLRHRRNCARDRLILSQETIQMLSEDAIERSKSSEAEWLATEDCLQKLPDAERPLLLSVHSCSERAKDIWRIEDS